uniref:Uncharacterized protein n=1 Tax=Oryza punctata TaxID=4537 RepID=A0A0E0MP75_ORYPU
MPLRAPSDLPSPGCLPPELLLLLSAAQLLLAAQDETEEIHLNSPAVPAGVRRGAAARRGRRWRSRRREQASERGDVVVAMTEGGEAERCPNRSINLFVAICHRRHAL